MEWKEVRLGDIVSIKSGLAYKGAFIGKGENILLGMGCVSFKDKFLFSGARPYEADCDDKYCVEPGDIVLATRQQSDNLPILAMPAIIPPSLKAKKIIYGTNLYKVENHSEVTNDFLFWQLKTPNYIDYISSVKTGSVVRMVTKKNVEDYVFRCPPKEVRDRISKLLWGLDRKIELNNKINDDLEEMAQAIFKNWFVDFEPFKDGKFVDSELGMIPEGWKVGCLGDITSNKSAKVKERTDVKVLSPVTTGELVLSEEYFSKQVFSSSIAKYKIVSIGDFAYNPARVNIGSLGRNEFEFDGCVSPVYVVFSVIDGYENYFDLFRKTDFFKDKVASLAIGGVRQSLSYDDLSSIETIIPNINIVEKFNNLYNQMKKTIKANKQESSRLSLLRDTLLPRLMSGELEVPE